MTVSLLSLAGIPPLAGFFAKYLVFGAAIENGYIGFVILGIITSLIGVYYYFGIIKAIFSGTATDTEIGISAMEKILFIGLILLTVFLGIFPDPFIVLLR
jgi:NADH-quinone oxidoreductase subunit N